MANQDLHHLGWSSVQDTEQMGLPDEAIKRWFVAESVSGKGKTVRLLHPKLSHQKLF